MQSMHDYVTRFENKNGNNRRKFNVVIIKMGFVSKKGKKKGEKKPRRLKVG